MKKILVYLPKRAVGMSAMLIKELCWVAAQARILQLGLDANPSDFVKLVSDDGQSVRCFTGNELSVDGRLDSAEQADAIFLCAFWGEAEAVLQENQKHHVALL